MTKTNNNVNGSLWFDTLDEPIVAEEVTTLPQGIDVAIVGAGFTGLWTAYYLKQHQPDLQIAILEAECVGFGASGRNGGWCMGWAMGIEQMLAHRKSMSKALQVAAAMQHTVDEIGSVCQRQDIDCHFRKGGTLTLATKPFDAAQLQTELSHFHQAGFTEQDFSWLSAAESRQRLQAQPNYGALYTPHCAAIHPARLVQGLAKNLRAQGVQIIEQTPVTLIKDKQLHTTRGSLNAEFIIRATEGYTDSIEGQKRQLMPLYSMMVATEELPEQVWQEIGLKEAETFGDNRRVTIYGQRTMDNRIAFGGRAGYYFGSQRKAIIPPNDPSLQQVEQTLYELLPILKDYKVTHRWGGLMGVPRHWRPHVRFDQQHGFGVAGGYTGEGVAASNLAARILADLVLQRDTDITRLCWVDDVPRHWEPEPLRWFGAGAIQWFGDRADRQERLTGHQSKLWGSLFERFAG